MVGGIELSAIVRPPLEFRQGPARPKQLADCDNHVRGARQNTNYNSHWGPNDIPEDPIKPPTMLMELQLEPYVGNGTVPKSFNKVVTNSNISCCVCV